MLPLFVLPGEKKPLNVAFLGREVKSFALNRLLGRGRSFRSLRQKGVRLPAKTKTPISGVFYSTKGFMTKEIVKHRKDEKKKPTLTPKERKAKKQEKKQNKQNKM